jgi:sulfite reductase (NADPH) flavoprotein alpha-component
MTAQNTASPLPALPVGEPQLHSLQQAVAGYNQNQLYWASGYLAGLAAGSGALPVAAPAAETVEAPTITILYGSQTGNGRRVAETLEREAAARGLAATTVGMSDYPAARLKQEKLLLLVVSTHGEGDPPDDAIALHEFLGSRRARGLDALRFAVLALGDSSYEHFCQTGRDFDRRLAAAGAKRLLDVVECDVDFDEPAAAWSTSALDSAAELVEALQPSPTAAGPVLRAVPAAPRWTREHPYPAEALAIQPIVGRDSTKTVLHVELSLADSGLDYQPGDAVGVVAPNPDWLVDDLLQAAGLDGAEPVADGDLREALARRYEITTLNRRFLDAWTAHTGAAALEAVLAAGGSALRDWMWRHQIVDVLRQYPADVPPDTLLGMLRKMPPRLYSIASAQDAVGEEVHLTVAEVAYHAWEREHWGSTSSWLARAVEEGGEVPVFIEPNERFRLPADPETPIIMIGPGTGVAPFRGFMQAREAAGATGRNWLFFGDRNFQSDFLYQAEWLRYRKQGLLTKLDVAFSRDGPEKRYVQHVMAERASELYAWLEEGAVIYVCGDAERMAPDVDAELTRIIAAESGSDQETAAERLLGLRKDGRYLRDVY